MKLSELDAYRAKMFADKIISTTTDKDTVSLNIAAPTKQVALTMSEINMIKEFSMHQADIIRKQIHHLQQQMKKCQTTNQIFALSRFEQRLQTFDALINKLADDETKD
jgi:hypothetical protein